jgi:vitamin B12 transporter
MVDGARISDPLGIQKACDISGIMSAGIERIEIVRGAMSSMYGADAAGGVVNIITKKGTARRVTLAGEGGSDKSFRGTVTASDVTEASSFFFMGSHFKTRGISKSAKNASVNSYDDDAYANTSAAGRMVSRVSDNAFVNFAMSYTDSKSDVDDGALEDDPNRINTSKLFTTRGEFSHTPFPWWNYKAGVSYM